MPRRGWLAVAAATVTFSSLLSLSAVSSIAAVVPPAVGGAVAVLFALWRVSPGSRLTWLSVVPGGVSAAVTALILAAGVRGSRRRT